MRRLSRTCGKRLPDKMNEPNLWEIGRKYPLPPNRNSTESTENTSSPPPRGIASIYSTAEGVSDAFRYLSPKLNPVPQARNAPLKSDNWQSVAAPASTTFDNSSSNSNVNASQLHYPWQHPQTMQGSSPHHAGARSQQEYTFSLSNEPFPFNSETYTMFGYDNTTLAGGNLFDSQVQPRNENILSQHAQPTFQYPNLGQYSSVGQPDANADEACDAGQSMSDANIVKSSSQHRTSNDRHHFLPSLLRNTSPFPCDDWIEEARLADDVLRNQGGNSSQQEGSRLKHQESTTSEINGCDQYNGQFDTLSSYNDDYSNSRSRP